MNFVEATIRLIDAILGLILGNSTIGICPEEFRENNIGRIGAADGEGITYDGPLRLAIQAENFSEIVQETRENEPARMTVFANCFGSLKQVFDLGEVGVGIALVNEAV